MFTMSLFSTFLVLQFVSYIVTFIHLHSLQLLKLCHGRVDILQKDRKLLNMITSLLCMLIVLFQWIIHLSIDMNKLF